MCLSSAREDLQAIVSASLTGPLGSEAHSIGFMVETAADFMIQDYRTFPSQFSEEYSSSKSQELSDTC